MSDTQLQLFEFYDDPLLRIIENGFPENEFYDLEYKSAQGGFPKEMWKTYSAFANTNTGIIVLGISEKKGKISIDGLNDEQIVAYQKQFWDDCNNPNTISANLLTKNDVREIIYKEKKLLVIRVPFAERTKRPVHLTKNPFGNTYKRNHEGDYRCTDDEVKRMIADSSAELKRDSYILEHYTLDDIDKGTLAKYRQLFSISKSGHPWNALNDSDFLIKLGAYRKDRVTKQEGITLAGLLMFGKEDSIQEHELLPNFFPEFREKLSKDKAIRWTDRIYPDGTWESNLLQFYLRVWPKLSSTLPVPFNMDKDQRIDETPAHEALREAFVNALIHTDYSLDGNIIIEQDADRFVFSNPGTMLVSLEQYYAGGKSECRNPSLQKMFMMIGRAEKAGSGVDKILTGWNDAHWRRPFVQQQQKPDRVELTMPLFSVLPEDMTTQLNDIFEDISNLTSDELTVLYYCLVEGSVTNHRLQYVLDMHRTDITELLKRMCNSGYLASDNNGRWTLYTINDKRKVDTSGRKVATSKSKVDTSDRKVATLEDSNLATSKSKVATSDINLATLSKYPKRMKSSDLERNIMMICKDKYCQKEEIATLLGRSEDYIRNKILPTMLKDKKLEKKYPYTINHPQQAYKTTDEYAEQL